MTENDEMDALFGANDRINTSLSYSRISDFDKNGPRALVERTFIGGEGVKIGSITDDWLFESETFYNKYTVFDGSKPTATAGKLADIIIKEYVKMPSVETILEVVRRNKFWNRNSDDVVTNYITNREFLNYIKFHIELKTSNKSLITTDDLELGKELATTLRSHKHSAHLFNNNSQKISQYKFEYKYEGIILRGIIDMVIINHEDKTVQLIDLKTGQGKFTSFMESFIKYRYYIQEAVYMKAFETICNNEKLKGYELLPFKFLYIGRKQKIPMLFTITEKWHQAALNGFLKNATYQHRGLNELLDEIVWHFENKQFLFTKSVHEANGDILLNDSFIDVK